MYEQRAYPNDKIPEDAYRKAWDYIQQMQQAQHGARYSPVQNTVAAC
jgi:hypothetical protein